MLCICFVIIVLLGPRSVEMKQENKAIVKEEHITENKPIIHNTSQEISFPINDEGQEVQGHWGFCQDSYAASGIQDKI